MIHIMTNRPPDPDEPFSDVTVDCREATPDTARIRHADCFKVGLAWACPHCGYSTVAAVYGSAALN